MSITARRLNRATLGRQLLLRREPLDVAEAVRASSPCRRSRRRRPTSPCGTGWPASTRPASTPSPTGRRSRSRTCSWERLGDRQPRMWWAPRTFAPLLHAPTGGPWSFGPRSSFVAAPVRLPPERRDEVGALAGPALPGGFGPASVQDVAQFSLLRRPVVRDALWDSTLLAYADRSRVIPPAYRRLITRQNGDVLPALLVDGYVAGV